MADKVTFTVKGKDWKYEITSVSNRLKMEGIVLDDEDTSKIATIMNKGSDIEVTIKEK